MYILESVMYIKWGKKIVGVLSYFVVFASMTIVYVCATHGVVNMVTTSIDTIRVSG